MKYNLLLLSLLSFSIGVQAAQAPALITEGALLINAVEGHKKGLDSAGSLARQLWKDFTPLAALPTKDDSPKQYTVEFAAVSTIFGRSILKPAKVVVPFQEPHCPHIKLYKTLLAPTGSDATVDCLQTCIAYQKGGSRESAGIHSVLFFNGQDYFNGSSVEYPEETVSMIEGVNTAVAEPKARLVGPGRIQAASIEDALPLILQHYALLHGVPAESLTLTPVGRPIQLQAIAQQPKAKDESKKG